jgi:hypothetical protein
VAENIRKRQDHIEFLESYIAELTVKIDEITEGRDIEKEIESLEFRLMVLSTEPNGKFQTHTDEMKKKIAELRAHLNKIKPVVDALVEERAFYRHYQSQL